MVNYLSLIMAHYIYLTLLDKWCKLYNIQVYLIWKLELIATLLLQDLYTYVHVGAQGS